jgi:hypothetical protein
MRDAKYAMESDLRMAKWKKESVREKLFPKLVEALDGLNGAACPPSTTEYNRVDRLIKQARRAL